jgi:hypothetical protein
MSTPDATEQLDPTHPVQREILEHHARETLLPGILGPLMAQSGRPRAELLIYLAAVMEGRLRAGEVSGIDLTRPDDRYMVEHAIRLLRAEARRLRVAADG